MRKFLLVMSAFVAMTHSVSAQTVAEPEAVEIDFSLSGAWFNPETPGQGWLLDISPTENLFFAAWFTWQDQGGHDWYTAQGTYAGDRAVVPLLRTSGGRFNDPSPIETDVIGEAEFLFLGCDRGELQFRVGEEAEPVLIPLHRLTPVPHACREPAPKVAFRFSTRAQPDGGGDFTAVTRDPDLIAELRAQLELPEDERMTFVLGTIARGDGGHNADWNWHFVPNAWRMVELAVEVCDGRPSDIEDDPDYWFDQLGYFCPWSSYVQAEFAELPSD